MPKRVNQKEVLAAYMQFFWEKETTPTDEQLAERTNYTPEQIRAVLARPEVIQTLAGFFIPKDTSSQGLTPQQIVWCNMLLNIEDNRSVRKKAQELGISISQHQAWMNNKKFREFLQSRAQKIFGQESWQVKLSLLANARSGDTAAQKLYLEMTGDYTPTSRLEGHVRVDVNVTINQLLEIVQVVCTPEQMLEIADNFEALMEGRTPPALERPKDIVDARAVERRTLAGFEL